MRHTNNGKVRVTTTHVQLGADEGVAAWHGKTKLWPPETPADIKAVTLDPDDTPFTASMVLDPLTFNRWNFLAIQRMLAAGKGAAKVDGYTVSSVSGYKVNFDNKPIYGDPYFAKGIYKRIDMTVMRNATVSGVVARLGTLRLETSIPFGNGGLKLTCKSKSSWNKMKTAYKLRSGYVVGGVDYQTDSYSFSYSTLTKTFKKTTSVVGLSGKSVKDYQNIQKKHPKPEKFYIVIENTVSQYADVTNVEYNPFFYGTCEARGKITKVHV